MCDTVFEIRAITLVEVVFPDGNHYISYGDYYRDETS